MQLIRSSENLDKFLPAFLKFQSKLAAIAKSSKGHNYKYTKLDAIDKAIRPILTECELILMQPVVVEEGKTYVITELYHTSGQFKKAIMEVVVDPKARMSEMQAMGSSITYARRYSLCMLNVLTEEDDDNASQNSYNKAQRNNYQQNTYQKPPQQKPTFQLPESIEAKKEIIDFIRRKYNSIKDNQIKINTFNALLQVKESSEIAAKLENSDLRHLEKFQSAIKDI